MDVMKLYKKEVNLVDSFFVNRRDGKGKQIPLPFRVGRGASGKLQMIVNQKYLCIPVHVPLLVRQIRYTVPLATLGERFTIYGQRLATQIR